MKEFSDLSKDDSHDTRGMAREFNTVITSLLGWSRIAQQDLEGKESLKMALNIIEANVLRAQRIADRMFDGDKSPKP